MSPRHKKKSMFEPTPPWYVVWGFRRTGHAEEGPFEVGAAPDLESANRLSQEFKSVGWYTATYLDKKQPAKLELSREDATVIFKVRPHNRGWNMFF